jgi:hypothetical protein
VTNVPKVNALSVVVNAQADAQAYQLDGEVKAHHGDDGELGIMPEISTGHHTKTQPGYFGHQPTLLLPSCLLPA